MFTQSNSTVSSEQRRGPMHQLTEQCGDPLADASSSYSLDVTPTSSKRKRVGPSRFEKSLDERTATDFNTTDLRDCLRWSGCCTLVANRPHRQRPTKPGSRLSAKHLPLSKSNERAIADQTAASKLAMSNRRASHPESLKASRIRRRRKLRLREVKSLFVMSH